MMLTVDCSTLAYGVANVALRHVRLLPKPGTAQSSGEEAERVLEPAEPQQPATEHAHPRAFSSACFQAATDDHQPRDAGEARRPEHLLAEPDLRAA